MLKRMTNPEQQTRTKDTGRVATPEVVALHSVYMRYGARDGVRMEALQDIGLSLEQGEFVCILGPSGCGKTTLLKIAAGLMRPSEGQVLHQGRPSAGPYEGLGLVFQTPVLLPWLTVLDNVLLPVRVLKRPVRDYRCRAFELLKMTGLAGFESRYPRELSGGMQQRVALVRAIIHDPKLLVMDEPFGALDALTRETMNAELQALWLATGKSVLFVTHSILESVFLSDRIVVMSARPGRIVSVVKVDAPRPRTYDMLSTGPLAELASSLRSVLGRGE
jgi:NitT/TauT family transport system ATP-binding protein